MHTDLFALAHGIDGAVADRVVPPDCRMALEAASPTVSNAGTIVESPVWRPRCPARHFVPALSVLASSVPAFRFELAIETHGEWSSWVAAAPIDGDDFTPPLPATDSLRCDIDVFTSRVPADAVRVRVRVGGGLVAPWLMTLSACDLAPVARTAGSRGRVQVTVPMRSQMIEPEPLRRHICSPASVAMVLERWGRHVETLALAAEIFQPALGRYGVWPAAVAAAGRHGVAGYLMRFPDWISAAWCLDAGLPIVASVRYASGELAGAAMDRTDGHLVVVTGYEDGTALLNDPAAPTAEEVARRVRIDDLERVWLERTGVGYVLFDPLQMR